MRNDVMLIAVFRGNHIRRRETSQSIAQSVFLRITRRISFLKEVMLRPLILIVMMIARHNLSAYNINTHDAKVYDDPARVSSGEFFTRRSYFGFSVALYTSAKEALLLVGAPQANSSELPFVTEPGAVFRCAMNGVCGEWVIDRTGNGPRPRERLINQIKNNAWIGATIVVENKTEPRVVVCLYIYFFLLSMNHQCFFSVSISSNAYF